MNTETPGLFKRAAKWLVTILCTIWIIPISCTVTALGGSSAFSSLFKERYDNTNSKIAEGFMVAVAPAADGDPFGLVYLGSLKKHLQAHPDAKVLMPKKQDSVSYEDGGAGYEVTGEAKTGTQEIEVENRGTSSNTFSAYRVSGGEIHPVSFRGYSVGHAMVGALIGLWLGVVLQRKAARWMGQRFFS